VRKYGVFSSAPAGLRARRKNAFDQVVHVMVMALSYWHADFRFVPVESLTKTPSPAQVECLVTVRKFLKAFGNCKDQLHVPSNRSSDPVALLSDLSAFPTERGFSGDCYHHGFPGAEDPNVAGHVLPPDDSRAEELRPYRPLEPSRLKIAGCAAWDPTPYLSDDMYLAYVEPKSLPWTSDTPPNDFPDLSKEKCDAMLDLVKLWDANGLVMFRKVAPTFTWQQCSIRFFNNYKNEAADRMIGDRPFKIGSEPDLRGGPELSRLLNCCR
jgi:hypothetical protein